MVGLLAIIIDIMVTFVTSIFTVVIAIDVYGASSGDTIAYMFVIIIFSIAYIIVFNRPDI